MIKDFLYPIKFEPILKEKVWGGNRLVSDFNKQSNKTKIGESWELSGVEDNISVVANGLLKGKSLFNLIKDYKEAFVGEDNFKRFGSQFPLLFKFIDAEDDLSIQLHPNDKIAKEKHNSFGKTEMWYVIDSEGDKAKIYNGFIEKVNKEDYINSVSQGNLLELINVEEVKKDDAFFIQPGTIHAIGKGVLLAEIQQASDVTYRVYDWDRKNEINGNARKLNNELAIEAIDFSKVGSSKLNYTTNQLECNIANCEYFVVNKIDIKQQYQKEINNIDSFVVYMCVGGEGSVLLNDKMERVKKGETILIPAITDMVKFIPKENLLILLEIYI